MDTPGAVRPKVKIAREPGVTITAYVPQKLADQIVTIAIREHRTLSSMAKILIEEAITKHKSR